MEYPVRLGECSSTGCKLFLLEDINLKCDNDFIPEHKSFLNISEMLLSIEDYIDNFIINNSINLYNNFNITYDKAVEYITKL